jgi:uncharacterized protein (TIGR03437 family)
LLFADRIGLNAAAAGPTIFDGGVVNGASFAKAPAPVAPGSIVSIFGTALASGTEIATVFPLPTTLQGTQVFINGIAAPLFYVSPSQINAQVPWEAGGGPAIAVQVKSNGVASNTVTAVLANTAPGVFVSVHAADYTVVTSANPAVPGEYLVVFSTGLGPVTNQPATGAPASTTVLSHTAQVSTVTIAGLLAAVTFSGLTPSFAGFYQVNVQVPANAVSASAAPLVLSNGGNSTTSAIALQSSWTIGIAPADGATVTTTPTITVTYSGGTSSLDMKSLSIAMDGIDSTAFFSVGSGSATSSPVLTGGQHTVAASIKTAGGANLQANSRFTVSSFRALPQVMPASGPAPLTVTFVTNAENTGGAITRYRWSFNGDGNWDTDDPGPQNYSHTFYSAGVRNSVLEVTNDKGQTASATVQVNVTGQPPSVTAQASPRNGGFPLAVNFSGSAYAATGTIAKYEWDFNGDGTYEFSSTTTASAKFTYTAQGTYTAVLRVTDSQGLVTVVSGASTTVRVGPAGSPTARISSPSQLSQVDPPAQVYFSGYGSSSGGTIAKYEWDFNGDGVYEYSSASSASTNYTYQAPGFYTAYFRVTDSKGLTGVDSVDIVITGPLISLSTDTLHPQQGDTLGVSTVVSSPWSVKVFIKNQTGKTVRTLVNNVQRSVGQYKDTWDAKDDLGNTVPEGLYYAIYQYTGAAGTQTVDLTTTTGGAQITYDPSQTQNWTMTTSDGTSCASYSGCSVNPYANDFLQVAFQLNQAASITFGIRLSDAGTQVTSVFSDRPFGRGSHTIYWDGTDQSGNLIVPPPYDSFSVNFGGFTLPQNAVFVEAAPQISAVAASPNYLDPFTGTYLSAPGQSTKISYTLSKQAAIALQVFSVDTGTLLRTITQPNVSAGSSTIAWDGRADNGIFAAQGSYRLALKAVDAQGSQSIIRYVLVKVFY